MFAKERKWIVVFMFLAAAALVLLGSGTSGAADVFPLRIIHVNDTHSHFDPTEITIKIGGESTYVLAGGYARLGQAAQKWRGEVPNSLLLHAGDTVQGTLYFTKYLGEADVALMNLMGFDAMALGNHEFDKGPGLLTNLAKQAQFPVLSANLDMSKEPELAGLVKPFTVKEIGGRKVGIIGLVTPETPTISSPGPTLGFGDPIAAAKAAVKELEGQGVNVIIALTHLGLPDDLALAAAVSGLDVVVGGHSHTLVGAYEPLGMSPESPYPTLVKNPDGQDVYVLNDWEWAKTVGRADFEFNEAGEVIKADARSRLLVGDRFRRKDKDGNKVALEGDALAGVLKAVDEDPNLARFPEEPTVTAKIKEYAPGVEELRKTVVAQVTADLLHVREPGVHKASSKDLPHGSLIAPIVAEGILWKLNDVGQKVDVALQNAGGVRIDIPQGDLTVAEVYELLPFGNTMMVIEITGAQIKAAIEYGVTKGSGAFPYVGGARFSADMTLPEGGRITKVEIRNAKGEWEPLDEGRTYRLSTNNFNAGGGDGYTMLKEAKGYRYDTGYVDAEVFQEYAQHLKELSPPAETGVTYKK